MNSVVRPMLLTPREKSWTPLARSISATLDKVQQSITSLRICLISRVWVYCPSCAGADNFTGSKWLGQHDWHLGSTFSCHTVHFPLSWPYKLSVW
jgi:hypothetical protein